MASVAQAEADAAKVLDAYWPQTPLPVDPFKIASSMGIEVRTAWLEDDVSGVIFQEDGIPTIHVNILEPHVRQRFTCAHEIGHYYLHERNGDQEYGYVDRRDQIASLGINADERYANRFGAALLMPAAYVKKWRHYDANQLAAVFQVSLAAMKNRLASV